MGIPLVWSEREYPHYSDCVFSGGLDALLYAGFDSFPLGSYSNAEREALERAGSHVPETPTTMAQLDENIANRYHLKLHTLSIPLSQALTNVGSGLVLFGINGNLPNADNWRRWDPAFTGEHCVSVYPLGNGVCRVLDPEAPMGFIGDNQPISKILQWAKGAGDVRYVKLNEFTKTFLGYRVNVVAGTYTLYSVVRYTHQLYNPVRVTFGGNSHATVYHGIPGFWMIGALPASLSGKYYVYGHTGMPFTIDELWKLGNGTIERKPIQSNI